LTEPTPDNIAAFPSDTLNKDGMAAQTLMKDGHAAMTESGAAAKAGVQELTKAYQELATKNVHNLTAAVQALSAVKSPTEFFELQQKLIKDGVQAAMADSRHIAELTTAAFTAAFEPVKKQIEAVRNGTRN